MSIYVQNTAQPTGFRRLTRPMIAARDTADRFTGVAKGSGDRFKFLAAFQEAEPYLGLPSHAYKLVSWLVGQTMPHDWEQGSRPIAWPSARLQQEFLGLSQTRVKELNRALFEAGIFVIRDNEQGKRYGRRGPDKRIIEAFGFDLSPLAVRFEEFVRFAAEARAERARMKDLRRRVTIARRVVRAVGELLEASDVLPQGWRQLAQEVAELVFEARRTDMSGDMAAIANALEALRARAEEWVREASNPVDIGPKGPDNRPHTTSTNQSYNLKNTVIAAEGSSGAEKAVPKTAPAGLRQDLAPKNEPRSVVARLKLSVEELVQLVPRLGEHIFVHSPKWSDAVDAAGGSLRHELGISSSLWGEACGLLGRDGATLALAIVATKEEGYFTSSAGGYFGGMVRRAAKGELWLEKSLWGLRQRKYGRPRGQGH